MVKYLSVSEWFWDFRIFRFSTVFVTVDYVPLFNKLVAWKPSLIWRRGSQNDRGWFPPARWWLCRSETAKIPLIPGEWANGLNEPMEQRPCRERLMPCPLWNRRTRVARLSRGSDRRGLPHGKEGGLRDYSCTHRDGEGKGRKIFQDPKHDHFSLIST